MELGKQCTGTQRTVFEITSGPLASDRVIRAQLLRRGLERRSSKAELQRRGILGPNCSSRSNRFHVSARTLERGLVGHSLSRRLGTRRAKQDLFDRGILLDQERCNTQLEVSAPQLKHPGEKTTANEILRKPAGDKVLFDDAISSRSHSPQAANILYRDRRDRHGDTVC